MAKRVVWTRNAYADLHDIAAFIAKTSPSSARSVVRKLRATALGLEAFPHLGASVPEIGNPMLRQRVSGRYRLIYRVTDDQIQIVAILHTRRSFATIRARFFES